MNNGLNFSRRSWCHKRMDRKYRIRNVTVVRAINSQSLPQKWLFNSSLKYLIVWMTVISGIRLDYPNEGRLGKRNIICACLAFFIIVGNGCYALSFDFKFLVNANSNTTFRDGLSNTELFTFLMDTTNWLLLLVGVHFAFLLSFLNGRWKNLYKCLVAIEQNHLLADYHQEAYSQRNIRNLVIIGFLGIALVLIKTYVHIF